MLDFAQQYVEDMLLVVITRDSDFIAGTLRLSWLKEMAPRATVIQFHHQSNDQMLETGAPAFAASHVEALRAVLPYTPDYLFASEDYDEQIAELLDMYNVPVKPPQPLVPISSTLLLSNPLAYWQHIPPCVRPYFVKRVCIYGPESTGKSTLAIDLAHHFESVYVEEYARDLLAPKQGQCDYEDLEKIMYGQRASEQAMARQANKLLFCDTDLLTTTVWSTVLFHSCPPWLYAAADAMTYDLYLVTDIDVPWIDDQQRYLSEQRQAFFDLCIQMLEQRQRPYVMINGTWEERLTKAIQAVEKLLYNFPPS